MDDDRHVRHLQEQVAKRQLALFIGADLPREVTGLPSRADLARDLARRKGLDESLSLAEIAQRVSQAGSRWEFTDFIRNALDTVGKSPQPFHQRIVELVQEHEIETLITTAYDNLLELAFQEAGIGINRVVRGSDVGFIARDRPTLIKLYGDAQQPDTLVVTEDDHYGLWRDRDKEDLLHEVRAVLRKQTVLFLGYNLADPDFNLLWREVLDRAGRFARTAYAVWPGLAEGEVRMWHDRGIVILEADPWGLFPEGVCSDSAISVTKNKPGGVSESSLVGEKMTQKSYGFLGTEWDSNAELVDWQCGRCKGRFASREEGIRHICAEHRLGTLYPRLNTSGRLSLADLLSAALGKTKREMLDILTHDEPSVLESMGFRAEVVEESGKAKDKSVSKDDGSAGGPAPAGESDLGLLRLVDVLSIRPEHDGRPHKAGPAQWFSRLRIESRTPIHGCSGKIYEIRRLDGPTDQQGTPLPEFHASCLSWGSRGRSGVFEPISIQPKDTEYLDLVWRAHGDPPIPEGQLRVASALDHRERNTSSSDWGKRQDFIPLRPGYYLLIVQVWADGYNVPVECTYRLHWPGPGQEDNIRLVELVGSHGPKGDGEETSPAPLYGNGNRWAVLVGVNEYEDKANYGQLHVCVKDVHAIRKQLIAGGFDPNRIRLLADETGELPTKANTLVALKAVADATEPDDLLLFYYSGHGDEEGSESYLIARDGRRLVLGDTAVPLSRVREIVEGASARAKVIVLDACHSGADIGGKGPKPMSEEFIRRVFEQAEGLAILASCKQGQLSYEWCEHERSAFTHFLLEALERQADRDEKGFVTVQDANQHVTNGVKLWASQRNLSQTPTLQYTVAGDIILLRYQ